MEVLKKIFIIALVIGALFYLKTIWLQSPTVENSYLQGSDNKQENPEDVQPSQDENQKPKETVTLYFIGQNSNKEDVYKIVKRNYDAEKDGSKLEYSVYELLRGPSAAETSKGIYSEIPFGTKIRAISKVNGKLYIDLSGSFEQGGGTDSLYKRLYQLIKTVNKNTSEDVYLKIDGREVDVIGGEGIMINQPLTSHSLDG